MFQGFMEIIGFSGRKLQGIWALLCPVDARFLQMRTTRNRLKYIGTRQAKPVKREVRCLRCWSRRLAPNLWRALFWRYRVQIGATLRKEVRSSWFSSVQEAGLLAYANP